MIRHHSQHNIKTVHPDNALGKHRHSGEFSRVQPPGVIQRVITGICEVIITLAYIRCCKSAKFASQETI